ncbi:hypothetical protein L3X38_010459 [Prunus dulcis]|uniref:Wall-associated receptor kinase galacturonan-binding domain-containing protein n=1 Tax=Prunus dulcis TaxID=3755 RepID=A0AAD4WFV5_PRUDU|nr:hypothetical protein L3X38_010459 [Prunus dulcis]
MAAGRVSVPSRLIVLVTVVGLYCGTFCAKDDDHHRYELSCENNVTMLYLYSGKYYVQAINYNNCTIRVVDANLRKGNCSSIPRNSFTGYNYSDHNPYSFQNPVNSPLYVETAPCTDAISSPSSARPHSQRNSFVMVGHVNASDLRELCHVELMSYDRGQKGSTCYVENDTNKPNCA